METHRDERRILYDWAAGNFKSAKAIEILQTISIGGHFHKNKDEEFLLLKGKFLKVQIGENVNENISAPYYINVPRGVYHEFLCEAGSILLGTATEHFDKNDEHTNKIT